MEVLIIISLEIHATHCILIAAMIDCIDNAAVEIVGRTLQGDGIFVLTFKITGNRPHEPLLSMLQLPICVHEDLFIPLLQHYFVEALTYLGYFFNLINDGIDPFEIDAGNDSL